MAVSVSYYFVGKNIILLQMRRNYQQLWNRNNSLINWCNKSTSFDQRIYCGSCGCLSWKLPEKELSKVCLLSLLCRSLPSHQITFRKIICVCFCFVRYENRTGRVSYRLGKRRRYIRSRPQFLIRRRWRRARRVKGRMSVRIGRKYRQVKMKGGTVAYGGKSRWRGIRRRIVRRRAVMRVRCGGKLRKIYKRGRRLKMNRKGRLRTVRWGLFCSAADHCVLKPCWVELNSFFDIVCCVL